MLPVSRKIMEVFKVYKIGRREALSWPSFESKTKRWERDLQDQLNEGFDELIRMQYIRISEDKFSIFLLDAGYNYLLLHAPDRIFVYKTEMLNRK